MFLFSHWHENPKYRSSALKLEAADVYEFLVPTYQITRHHKPEEINLNIELMLHLKRGTRWRSWLKHCATSRKIAGPIPDGVIGIFHLNNPSGRTMALGVTQPLTEMTIRNISSGLKAAGAQGWKPYYIHVPIVLKFGSLNILKPSGPVQACNGIALLQIKLYKGFF
jgi:hypothetical protein